MRSDKFKDFDALEKEKKLSFILTNEISELIIKKMPQLKEKDITGNNFIILFNTFICLMFSLICSIASDEEGRKMLLKQVTKILTENIEKMSEDERTKDD